MIHNSNLIGSVSREAGGLFEGVLRLVQCMKQQGVDVRVFGRRDQHTDADLAAWDPVPVEVFPTVPSSSFCYSKDYSKALDACQNDILHSHGLWQYHSIVTTQYALIRKVPYVISAHGMLDPWAIRNSRWKKALAYLFYEKSHLKHAGCLRALCLSEADSIRKCGLKNPVAIIPNGIDMQPRREVLPDGSETYLTSKAPWDRMIPKGKKVMLFLSRIHPKKGLPNLIRAWAALQKESASGAGTGPGGDWVLAIAGWDQNQHEAELKRIAAEVGLTHQDLRDFEHCTEPREDVSLYFLGPQFNQDKRACYERCSAFVLPSFSEGVPMVVLEAWVNAKPVVMTPECNLPCGFEKNAAICITTDVEGIRKGLCKFLTMNPRQQRDMGEAGYRLASEKFSWPKLSADLIRLYEWMLGGGARPEFMHD